MSKEHVGFKPEATPLNAQRLLRANRSEASRKRIESYKKAKDEGKLTLFKLCADARSGPSWMNIAESTVDRSIAAGSNTDDIKYAIRHEGVGQIVIATHFDGALSSEEGFFKGCGGQAAYHDFCGDHAQEPHTHPVGPYIENSVFSDNPFVQAFKLKDQVMKQFEEEGDFKPIMLGALDHVSGLFIPVWHIERDDEGICHTHGKLQSHHIQNPHNITPKNLEWLRFPVDKLPDHFRELIHRNLEYVEEMRNADPDYQQKQKVQNPHTIVVTTSMNPLRNRYAGECDRPNEIFVVGAPFVKEVSGEKRVVNEDRIFQQVSYPVIKSIQAAHEDAEFGLTKGIVFETDDIAQSATLAKNFLELPFAKEWCTNKRASIVIAETQRGITTRAIDLPARF